MLLSLTHYSCGTRSRFQALKEIRPPTPNTGTQSPGTWGPSTAQITPILRLLQCLHDRTTHGGLDALPCPVPTGLRPGGHNTAAGYSSTFVSIALTLWGPWGARLLSQGEGG